MLSIVSFRGVPLVDDMLFIAFFTFVCASSNDMVGYSLYQKFNLFCYNYSKVMRGVYMQTIQLDIQDDKLSAFLTIVKNLKSDMVQSIRTSNDILDIESIETDSLDYIDIVNLKKQNNKKYSIDEAKEKLGF